MRSVPTRHFPRSGDRDVRVPGPWSVRNPDVGGLIKGIDHGGVAGYVVRMDETQVADTVDLAGGDGRALAGSPERAHDPADGRVELPEPPERLYLIHITSPANPSDPELAAALQEVYEAADRDPNSFRNNPEKAREAREGLRRFLDDWQAENGAFTEEERARAQALLYGP